MQLTNLLRRTLYAAIVFSAMTSVAQETTVSTFMGSTPEPFKAGALAEIYALSDLDTINLHGGGLAFNVPLLTIGGRGSAGYTISANIRRNWRIDSTYNDPGYTYLASTAYTPFGDWWSPKVAPYSPGAVVGRQASYDSKACISTEGPDTQKYSVRKIVFISSDRGETELLDRNSDGDVQEVICNGGSFSTYERGKVFRDKQGQNITFISDETIRDEAGYSQGNESFFLVTGYLLFGDGTRYRVENSRITKIIDRNGNYTTISYDGQGDVSEIVDPLNRSYDIDYALECVNDICSQIHTISYTRTLPDGTAEDREIVLTYLALSDTPESEATKSLNLLWGTYGGSDSSFDPTVLYSITFPSNKQYKFAYNSYGELIKALFPTGGYVKYAHEGGTVQLLPRVQPYRRVTERKVFDKDDALLESTTYQAEDVANVDQQQPDENGLYSNTITTVTVKNGSGTTVRTEKHFFYGGPGNIKNYGYLDIEYPRWRDGKRYRIEIRNESGQLVSSSDDIWQQRPCETGEACLYWDSQGGTANVGVYWTPNDPRLITTRTSSYTPGSANELSASVSMGYDRYNNVTSKLEYGHVEGAGTGDLLRQTITSYVGTVTGIDEVSPVESDHLRSLVSAVEVFDGSPSSQVRKELSYDETPLTPRSDAIHYEEPLHARGNLTKVRDRVSGGSFTEAKAEYDVLGNVVKYIDGNENATTFRYEDAFAPGSTNLAGLKAYAFLTETENALGHKRNSIYNYWSGKMTFLEDFHGSSAAGEKTAAKFEDSMDRITSLTNSAGSEMERTTNFTYGDDPGPLNGLFVRTESPRTFGSSDKIEATIYFDGFGRPTSEVLSEDSSSIVTQREYGVRGRVTAVTNPFRTGEGSAQWTQMIYDSLDRKTQTIAPDGAVSSVAYDRNITTLTDPALKSVRQTADSLGRLVEVVEAPGVLGYTTRYVYNARDGLELVCQGGTGSASECTGGRKRVFSYDDKGRLTSAYNPESGTTTYTYDNASNLLTKRDARLVVTCFGTWNGTSCQPSGGYDELNRPKKKTHSDGTPEVGWVWDTTRVGSLYTVGNTDSTYRFDEYFDNGWVKRATQITGSLQPEFRYTYHPNGSLATMKYPSNRVVAWTPDEAGRVHSVSLTPEGGIEKSVWVANEYAPHGALRKATLGNGLIEQWAFNPTRQQPWEIQLGTAIDASSVGRWQFRYCGSFGATSCAANNGNVMGQSIGIPGVEQSYAYDLLNRLSRVEEGSESRDFAYDAFGNMWVANASSGFARDSFTPATSAWFDANNRLANPALGVQHDNAGNLTAIGGFLYEYNADGMMTKATPSIGSATEYRYDGEGRRVTKQTGTEPVTTFVYDAFGGLAAEYGTAPTETGTHYITADHLGSTRLVTDATGAVISRHDYLPFGEEIGADGTTRTTAMKYVVNDDLTQRFTGKERDTETGLDYFGARYFSGVMGRWTSSDPLMASARTWDPQSWNRYTYSFNNPLKYVDPNGMDVPKECIDNPDCRITVKVNVIYSSNTRISAQDRKGIERAYLDKAKKDYGNSNIDLKISYTEGVLKDDTITGLKADSLNVVFTGWTPPNNGEAGTSGIANDGSAFSIVNPFHTFAIEKNWVRGMFVNTLEHEMAHHLLGHTSRSPEGLLDYLGAEREANGAAYDSGTRPVPQLRQGTEHKIYAVPTNPDANKPRTK